MNSGNKRLIQTIIVSGLSVLIGYLINFFVTPYITSNIGMDAYGFVSIGRHNRKLCNNYNNRPYIFYCEVYIHFLP